MKSPHESIVALDLTGPANAVLLERLINGVMNNKYSLLVPEIYFLLTRPMSCLAEPEKFRLAHPSAETFASGNLHLFHNKKMNIVQQNYLSYRYRTNAELGMWTGYSRHELTSKVTDSGIKPGVGYVKCIDSYVEEPAEERFSLKLKPLSTVFLLAAQGFLISLLCLFCELIHMNLPRAWSLLGCIRKPIRVKSIAQFRRN